jgi:outer membrane protein
MVTAASVIDSFKRQVSFAEENYSMVFKQFTFGLSDSVDVIDADTTLVSAQRGLSRASFDYELATLELLKSAGMLLNEMENIMAGRD